MISDSDRKRFFKNDCGRGGVFDCHSCAIENDDLGSLVRPVFLPATTSASSA